MHPSLTGFTFGAEFEVLLPYSLTRASAVSELARRTGLQVFNGRNAPAGWWKVVDDGSVRGSGAHGLEFVSPILKGETGLQQVANVATALLAMGATVNSSCGFHVHVGNHGGQLSFFKSLVKLYGRYEQVIDSLMPGSRRANAARYCRSLTMGLRDIDNCNSAQEIAQRLWRASGADAPKYHKVNIVPAGKPTVEFRHHAGTVDAVKATNWIVTCLRMVLAAQQGKTGEGAMIALDTVNLALKTRAMIEMCSRPEGATIREICERFGFSTISVKRHAGLAGVAFTKRGERYFVVAQAPAPVGGAAPLTLSGLADLIEADTETRAFFTRRAAALAVAR